MKFIGKILLHQRNMVDLINENKEKVNEYNKKMLHDLLYIYMGVLFIPLIISLMATGLESRVLIYLTSITILLLILLAYKKGKFDKNPLWGLYPEFILAFGMGITLSIVSAPYQPATIITGLFCVIPLCYIDRIERKFFILAFFYCFHTYLSYQHKIKVFANDDLINGLCFVIIGLFLSNVVQNIKLESLRMEKKILFERETDILTGLKNRRKMFELFVDIEQGNVSRPDYALMLDIDYFKAYNDNFGHLAGDTFLGLFGKELLQIEKQFNIKFFRYGGEEIAAFGWECALAMQKEVAEKIRTNAENIKDEYGGRTISIGVFDCTSWEKINCEEALDKADEALYRAKESGRNKVVFY